MKTDLRDKIADRIAQIDAVADVLPGVVIIHNVQKGFSVEYMSAIGLAYLGHSLEEIKAMGTAYYERFFNQEDVKDYLPRIAGVVERNNMQEIFSLFQQVRPSEAHDWSWHLTTIRILMQDDKGKPLLITAMAFPVDPLHHITNKVSRLLDENSFLRGNYYKFSKLGKREREILRLLAMGKTAAEIAQALFIAVTTVETHRRNIKEKLEVHTAYELSQYARAFDLI